MKRLVLLGSWLVCAAMASPALAAAHGSISGRVEYLGSSILTVRTPGPRIGVVNAMTRAATALAKGNWPYVWGGGHAEAGVASVGGHGPGYTGHRRGFDCSGSVAAVLSAARLWQPGSGVPNDYGVIRELAAMHLIARGPGRSPVEVTLYDDPGVHIFMNIDGRFFGTSDGAGGNAKGGPTWLDDSAADSWSHAYRRWHFLPSVLRNRVTYGHSFTFQTTRDPSLAYGAELGDRMTVGYAQAASGAMFATAVSYAGARTVTGTVTSLTPGTLILQTGAGPVALSTTLVGDLLSGLQLGDTVAATYSRDGAGRLVPHAVQVVAGPPSPPTPPGPAAPPGP